MWWWDDLSEYYSRFINLREPLLWSTLHWPYMKSECQKCHFAPNWHSGIVWHSFFIHGQCWVLHSNPTPPPTPEMKRLQIWKFCIKLDFSFQSATLSAPPPGKWKVGGFGTFRSSWKVGLHISKCHSVVKHFVNFKFLSRQAKSCMGIQTCPVPCCIQ